MIMNLESHDHATEHRGLLNDELDPLIPRESWDRAFRKKQAVQRHVETDRAIVIRLRRSRFSPCLEYVAPIPYSSFHADKRRAVDSPSDESARHQCPLVALLLSGPRLGCTCRARCSCAGLLGPLPDRAFHVGKFEKVAF